jgi:hypothetical protein
VEGNPLAVLFGGSCLQCDFRVSVTMAKTSAQIEDNIHSGFSQQPFLKGLSYESEKGPYFFFFSSSFQILSVFFHIQLKNVVETEFVFEFPGLPWTYGTQG